MLSPLCVGALFVGEHLVRYRLHPEFERTRMIDAVRAFYGKSPSRSRRAAVTTGAVPAIDR